MEEPNAVGLCSGTVEGLAMVLRRVEVRVRVQPLSMTGWLSVVRVTSCCLVHARAELDTLDATP